MTGLLTAAPATGTGGSFVSKLNLGGGGTTPSTTCNDADTSEDGANFWVCIGTNNPLKAAFLNNVETFNAAQTFSAQILSSKSVATNVPALKFTGVPLASASNGVPVEYFDPNTTTVEPGTGSFWSANGTMLGWNLAASFTGNVLDEHLNGAASNFTLGAAGNITATSYGTISNCANGASPAVCGSAASGVVAVPTGVTPTLVINTTAVTASSRIFVQGDESATITAPSTVTCNTTLSTLVQPVVTARTAGTSFTIQMNSTLATNPACVSFFVVN
jgi:hypothetical protein